MILKTLIEWSKDMDDNGSKSRWIEMAVKVALSFAALEAQIEDAARPQGAMNAA